jgi:hypothetical protein
MAITNVSKPSTSLVNPDRVATYETWDSNTSTWDTETRTWNEMGTTWTNQLRTISDFFFSPSRTPLNETNPFLIKLMTNIAKP